MLGSWLIFGWLALRLILIFSDGLVANSTLVIVGLTHLPPIGDSPTRYRGNVALLNHFFAVGSTMFIFLVLAWSPAAFFVEGCTRRLAVPANHLSRVSL